MYLTYILRSFWGGDLAQEEGKIQPLMSGGYFKSRRRGYGLVVLV